MMGTDNDVTAPMPGPVADALAWLRRMCEPYTDDAADALAAWAEAQRERDRRLAALCRVIARAATPNDGDASVDLSTDLAWTITRQLLAAAAELDGGDGGGA